MFPLLSSIGRGAGERDGEGKEEKTGEERKEEKEQGMGCREEDREGE